MRLKKTVRSEHLAKTLGCFFREANKKYTPCCGYLYLLPYCISGIVHEKIGK